MANEAYWALLTHWKEIAILAQVEGVLGWDMDTYLPSGAAVQRGEQFALISALIHERKTHTRLGHWLDDLEDSEVALDRFQQRNIHLIRRAWQRAYGLPRDLVENLARQIPVTVEAWKAAKAQANFRLFRDEFARLLEFKQREAEALCQALHFSDSYDVFLDDYEPGLRSRELLELFDLLKRHLVPLLQHCLKAVNPEAPLFLRRAVPLETQKQLINDVLQVLGYDLQRGRVDEAVHPFSSGSYDDVRLTTRYEPNDFTMSFWSILHEAGHGLYEQNLAREWRYQPLGTACSLGIHESQSRFIENMLGRSAAFWEFYLPRLKRLTGDTFEDLRLLPFLQAINHVQASPIRTEADEVTYSLHVILRFELERALLYGEVSLDDLPALWNQKMSEYLGVEVRHDAEGVLQDTHWSGGALGYFPTYVMGNLYSAQLFACLRNEHPNYQDHILQGNLSFVTHWLKQQIHQRANLFDPGILLQEATGEPLNPMHYIHYLNEKYGALFRFEMPVLD